MYIDRILKFLIFYIAPFSLYTFLVRQFYIAQSRACRFIGSISGEMLNGYYDRAERTAYLLFVIAGGLLITLIHLLVKKLKLGEKAFAPRPLCHFESRAMSFFKSRLDARIVAICIILIFSAYMKMGVALLVTTFFLLYYVFFHLLSEDERRKPKNEDMVILASGYFFTMATLSVIPLPGASRLNVNITGLLIIVCFLLIVRAALFLLQKFLRLEAGKAKTIILVPSVILLLVPFWRVVSLKIDGFTWLMQGRAFYLTVMLLSLLALLYAVLIWKDFPSPAMDKRRKILLSAAYILIPAGLYILSFYFWDFRAPIEPYHDGEVIYDGLRLYQGDVPYRDYSPVHGIMYDGGYASIAFRLFKYVSVNSYRFLYSFIVPTASVLVYLLCVSFFGFANGIVTYAIFMIYPAVLPGASVVERFLMYCLTFFFFVLYVRNKKRIFLFLSIILMTLGLFFTLEAIAVAVAINLAYLWWKFIEFRNRTTDFSARTFISNAFKEFYLFQILCWIVFAGVLYFGDFLGPFIRNSMFLMAKQGHSDGIRYPNFFSWPAFFGAARQFVSLAPIVYLLSFVHILNKKTKEASPHNIMVVLLFAFQFLIYSRALDRSDIPHIEVAYGLFPILVMCLFMDIPRKFKRAFLVAIFVGLAYYNLNPTWGMFDVIPGVNIEKRVLKEDFSRSRVERRLGDAGLSEGKRIEAETLNAFLRANKEVLGNFLFDFTNVTLLSYFLVTEARNPSTYCQVALAVLPEEQDDVVESLKKTDTKIVLWKANFLFERFDDIPNEIKHYIMAGYILRNFRPYIKIGDLKILVKNTVDPDRINYNIGGRDLRDKSQVFADRYYDLKYIPHVMGSGRNTKKVQDVARGRGIFYSLEIKDAGRFKEGSDGTIVFYSRGIPNAINFKISRDQDRYVFPLGAIPNFVYFNKGDIDTLRLVIDGREVAKGNYEIAKL